MKLWEPHGGFGLYPEGNGEPWKAAGRGRDRPDLLFREDPLATPGDWIGKTGGQKAQVRALREGRRDGKWGPLKEPEVATMHILLSGLPPSGVYPWGPGRLPASPWAQAQQQMRGGTFMGLLLK